MICPKCKIENKNNFCIKCGYMLNENEEVQIHYYEEGKRELDKQKLKNYIGDDYYKILNTIYNFKALILGPLYYIYRKCYLIGYIILLINIYIISFLLKTNQKLLIIFLIINALFHCCFFNTIYIRICKIEMQNRTILTEKGKSIIAVFISILIIFITLIISYII